jgi:hypothetical protein
MVSLLVVACSVVLDAQQHTVVRVVAQPLHLCRGLARLEWDEVVAVHSGAYPSTGNAGSDAVSYAPFAQAFGTLPHDSLRLTPPLIVEHLHVFGSVSFHCSISKFSLSIM